MSNWNRRYANENDDEEEPNINFWHPFSSQEEYEEAEEIHYKEQEEEEKRQRTHDQNHKFYIDNFARKGLKDTPEAAHYYRTQVVPFKKNQR